GRADADPGERAGDGGRRRIRRGDPLAAGGLERDRERGRSIYEGKVRRQDGLDIAAGEVDLAGVTGVRPPARLLGGDREAERRPRRLGGRRGQDQLVVRGRGGANQRADNQVGYRRAHAGDIIVAGPGRIVRAAGARAAGDVVEVGRVIVQDAHHLLRAAAVKRRLAALGETLV